MGEIEKVVTRETRIFGMAVLFGVSVAFLADWLHVRHAWTAIWVAAAMGALAGEAWHRWRVGSMKGGEMKSSNVKHPIRWENVVVRGDVLVNGEARPKILIDIQAPKDGLFLVTVDPEGKELSRTKVPTK